MTNQEILSLAYQLRSAGDTRDLSVIIAEVKADAASLAVVPDPQATVGAIRLVMPDGSIQQKEIRGDGSTVSIYS